ncbi:MAG: hypothetical protein MUF15_10605 [Acidobacteria bacterium]|nr:hypothetical protein [Acidobacteriota bacterium]
MDEYEEILSIIDELSYRELAILSVLSKHAFWFVFKYPVVMKKSLVYTWTIRGPKTLTGLLGYWVTGYWLRIDDE